MAKRKNKSVANGQTLGESIDFERLHREIATAVRRAFAAVRSKSAAENLYVFALVSDDSSMTVCPAANTVEAFRARTTESGATAPEEVNVLRWAYPEWGDYCRPGADEFRTVRALINVKERYDAEDPNGFIRFKARVFASMVLGLLDLEFEGFFGTGPARDRLTLLCQIADSWDSVWLEDESARRLNPAKLYKAFRRQWKTYRADDLEVFEPDEDELYQEFVRFLDARPGEAPSRSR
jgi:hypothetical protein